MPDFHEPVTIAFVIKSIIIIFAIIAIGIFGVKKFKKEVY